VANKKEGRVEAFAALCNHVLHHFATEPLDGFRDARRDDLMFICHKDTPMDDATNIVAPDNQAEKYQ
jgi:hypothetical protein